MTLINKKEAETIQRLIDAVCEEIDMDAASKKLGQAINAAQELVEAATSTRRNNAYMDQSKW